MQFEMQGLSMCFPTGIFGLRLFGIRGKSMELSHVAAAAPERALRPPGARGLCSHPVSVTGNNGFSIRHSPIIVEPGFQETAPIRQVEQPFMKKHFFFLLALAVSLASSSPASANPVDLYGLGAPARGLSGAFTGLANDFAALYYNPAGLVQTSENSFTVGYMSALPRMSLRLAPDSETTARQRDSLDALERSQTKLRNVNAYEFGLLLKPHPRFTAGIAAHVPVGGAVVLHPVDPHVPTFMLYDHYAERTTSFAGCGIDVYRGLSVGFGVSMFANVDGQLDVPFELDNSNFSADPEKPASKPLDLPSKLKIRFPWSIRPFAGLMYRPTEWMRFGASYRSEYWWDVRMRATADLAMKDFAVDLEKLRELIPDLNNIRTVVQVSIPALGRKPISVPIAMSDLSGTVVANLRVPISALLAVEDFWSPQQASFGASFEPMEKLTLTTDATWYDWSSMPSPDMKLLLDDVRVHVSTLPANIRARIQNLTIPVIGTVGPVPQVSASIPGISATLNVPLKFKRPTTPPVHDVVHPRIGAEYRFAPWMTETFLREIRFLARGGYAYEQSPFEIDRGYTSVIDPDRHVFSAGMGVRLRERYSLDSYSQYRYLLPVSYGKTRIDSEMPFAKLDAEGAVYGAGVQAGVTW
jgi:long-subunit fatty acid transport protein